MRNTNKIEDAAPRSQFDGHTPGPWGAVPTHPLSGSPWWAIIHDGRGPIVDVGGVGQVAEAKYLTTPEAEVAANARLIASAPDLLAQRDELAAALEAMTRYHYGTRELDPEISSHIPAIAARAALAKVTR